MGMKTKEKLIAKIQQIEDESLLQDLLKRVDLEIELSSEIVQLDEDQKRAIDEGLKDIEEGRILSDQEAREMVNEWMKKK
jgi:hypothetical protein